jgi:hypothetical protein
MAKRISDRKRVEITETTREFEHKERSHGGYSFECKPDSRGGYVFDSPAIVAKVVRLENNGDYMDRGYVTTTRYITEAAVIECALCGARVQLHGNTNTCSVCGRDYNMSGDELAPARAVG